MSKLNIKKIQQAFIDAIDERIRIYAKNIKCDITLYGKVISVSGGKAIVDINENRYECSVEGTVNVGQVVRVHAPNSDYKKLYIHV